MKENYWKIENEIATVASRDIIRGKFKRLYYYNDGLIDDEKVKIGSPYDDDWIYALKGYETVAIFDMKYKDGFEIGIRAQIRGEMRIYRKDIDQRCGYGTYYEVKDLIDKIAKGKKTIEETFDMDNWPWIGLSAFLDDTEINLCDLFSGPFDIFSSLDEVIDTLSNPENLKLIRDEVKRMININS